MSSASERPCALVRGILAASRFTATPDPDRPKMRYREWLRKVDMPTPKLTNEIITAAIEGFESQKRRIDDQIAELRAMLPAGTTDTAATPEAPTRKRKKFSAAARKRMKEAQQLRWAKIRGESEPPAPATPAKPKRKLSKAGKAAIVAALKKRWASKKAEAAKSKPAVAKKAAVKKAAVKKAPAAKKIATAAAHTATEAAGQ
jgi:hypothetical protein